MDLTEANKIMKAIVYTRVSTKEQVEGYSLIYQEKLCKEFCEKQGWEVLKVFQEQGESAKTVDRTQLLKLLKFCAENKDKADIVVVHKIDRVARVTADYHAIRAAISRYGMVLKSVSEPIDGSAQGKFMENIYAAVAQLDNDVRAERTKAGLIERVKQGLWAWGAPLVYLNSPSGLIIDKERAPLIKKAFETYALGLYTIKDIAKLLNKWGLKSKYGNRIKPQIVSKIFSDKKYMGILEVSGWSGEQEGIHEKIVSSELFNKVQLIRQGKSFTAVPRLTNNPDFPLKNIIECPDCSKKLTGSWSKGRKQRYAYYHCICGKTRIAKKILEDTFYEMLKRIQPNEKFIKLFSAVLYDVWKRKQSDMLSQLDRIDRELNGLKILKNKLMEKNLNGIVTDEDFVEQNNLLKSEIAVKEVERSEYRNEETNIDYLVTLSENLFRNVANIWLEAKFDDKLRFQSLLFPKGVFYKEDTIGTVALGLPFSLIPQKQDEQTSLVARTRFELVVFALRRRRPEPLDERAYY